MMIQEWKYIAAQSGLNVILEDVIVTENKNYKVQQISSETRAHRAHTPSSNHPMH